jgi:hypothetical protein
MKASDFTKIPIEEITEPPEKSCCVDIITNHYWGVTDDGCVLLYRGYSRQCNSNKEIAEKVCGSENHPATSVQFIERAYIPHDCSHY